MIATLNSNKATSLLQSIVFGLCLLLMAIPANGSHMRGADLSYECVNACTVRVYLRGYRNCDGVASFSSVINFATQTPGCTLPAPVAAWSPLVTTEITPICPGVATRCTTPGAALGGVEEYFRSRDYDICSSPNCIFQLTFTDCCRSSDIASLSNPGATALYLLSATLNTNLIPCNSSPLFSNQAIAYVCSGQPYTVNQAGTDPDGDSLSYTLGTCYQGLPNMSVTYAPGFSGTQPLGPSWNVQIDPVTGALAFTPLPGNALKAVICIEIHEWRNGMMIGTVTRDVQVDVIQCAGICGSNLLEGTLYHDLNSNCIFDLNETPFSNRLVTLNSGLASVMTDAQGKYSFRPVPGTYVVEPIVPNYFSIFQLTCPPTGSYTVTFPAQNDSSLGNDFGHSSLTTCPVMTIYIGGGMVRPCFSSPINVYYANQGSVAASNVLVTVELDSIQIYQSVTGATLVGNTGNTYSFSLGTVGPGVSGTFSITAVTTCTAAPLGRTICMVGHIYPDSICLPPNPLWDQSHLAVTASCVGDTQTCFTVNNTGAAMQSATPWRFFVNDTMSTSGTLQLCSGCDTIFCFPADGRTFRFEADQSLYHPGFSHPNAVVELCGSPFNTLGLVTSMPLDDLDHFVDVACRTLVNSYDPNAKSVSPTGAIAPFNYVDSTAELTYTIDFQNLGTANAIRVIIEDSLDPGLDILSVQPTASSFPYTFQVLSGRRLQFLFDNINLLPASQDSALSRGWVQYSVKMKSGLVFGDSIRNNADIFFDNNLPIRTNTVKNTVGWPETPVSVAYSSGGIHAIVWPNPAENSAFLRVTGIGTNESLHFELQTLHGQTVSRMELLGEETYPISLHGLAKGIYVYRVIGAAGLVSAGKLIVR